jgi:hypothetical protein
LPFKALDSLVFLQLLRGERTPETPSPHRGLGTTKVEVSKVEISRTLIFKPRGLIGIFDRIFSDS